MLAGCETLQLASGAAHVCSTEKRIWADMNFSEVPGVKLESQGAIGKIFAPPPSTHVLKPYPSVVL